MLYRLIVLTGPLRNQRVTVEREPMTLGSATDCTLVLPDDEVAAKHAMLEDRGEGGLHIRDLGTMHRILVNSREIRQSRLKHGDMVEIGRTRFLVQAVVAADVADAADVSEGKMNPRLIAAAAVVVVLGVVTWWRWPETHPSIAPPRAEPEPAVVVATTSDQTAEHPVGAVDTNDVEVTHTPEPGYSSTLAAADFTALGPDNQSTQMTAEIARMRADLAEMHEKIKSIASPPSIVPRAETVTQEVASVAIITPRVVSEPLVVPPVAIIDTGIPELYRPKNSLPPTNLPGRPAASELTNMIAAQTVSPAIISPTGRVLRVLNVEQSRFPASDDYDDMRTFNIVLSLANPRFEIAKTDISVDLTFFDEDLETGDIRPSRSVLPIEGLRPTSAWGSDRRCTVSATYVLPKGARAKEKGEGREARYYGFSARVTYLNRTQDEWALPHSLLKNIATEKIPTNAIKSAQANIAP